MRASRSLWARSSDHLGGREQQGMLAPDAPAHVGDDRDVSVEIAHLILLRGRGRPIGPPLAADYGVPIPRCAHPKLSKVSRFVWKSSSIVWTMP